MVRITGTTRLVGVIGWPIEHSLSPIMHNAVYDELGLDWAYIPMPIEDEVGLRRVVAAVRALPFVGFNVTMPYKTAILELCDEVSAAAKMANAVNTVHCCGGRLVGYNTDGRGMLESLAEEAGFEPAGKRIVLVGSGGAAGSAIVAFILARVASVHVVSRDLMRADALIARVAPYLNAIEAAPVTMDAAEDVIRRADLIVNATPIGMNVEDASPVPSEWLHGGQVVLDMVYGRPQSTALVSSARSAGANAIDGLGMLVCQGAIAVDIWNADHEARASRATMRSAADAEMVRRAECAGAR